MGGEAVEETAGGGIVDHRFGRGDGFGSCRNGGSEYRHFVAMEVHDLFEHREKFVEAELLEEGGELGEVFGVDGGGGPVERGDGDIELKFDEFAGVFEEVEIVAKSVADFSGDGVLVGDEVVDVAVGGDPFGGGFGADAGDAGDVVDGVAGEGEDIAGLLGCVSFFLKERGGVDFLVRLDVVHHAFVVDELIEVFILSTHVNAAFRASGIGADVADEGGDGVIGFEAFCFVERDVERVDDLENAIDLRGHVFGHRFALGFVAGVERFPAGGAGVHGEDDVRRFAHLKKFEQHGDKAKGRVGRLAGRRFESHDRIVGTVNLSVAVDDVKGMGHKTNPELGIQNSEFRIGLGNLFFQECGVEPCP